MRILHTWGTPVNKTDTSPALSTFFALLPCGREKEA